MHHQSRQYPICSHCAPAAVVALHFCCALERVFVVKYFAFQQVGPVFPVASLLLVAMPGAPSSDHKYDCLLVLGHIGQDKDFSAQTESVTLGNGERWQHCDIYVQYMPKRCFFRHMPRPKALLLKLQFDPAAKKELTKVCSHPPGRFIVLQGKNLKDPPLGALGILGNVPPVLANSFRSSSISLGSTRLRACRLNSFLQTLGS